MKYYTYVLHSASYDKIYIGQTEDLQKRLNEHNLGLSFYTKRYIPWKIIYTEELDTRTKAMKREKELKSHKGRNFIRSIIHGWE